MHVALPTLTLNSLIHALTSPLHPRETRETDCVCRPDPRALPAPGVAWSPKGDGVGSRGAHREVVRVVLLRHPRGVPVHRHVRHVLQFLEGEGCGADHSRQVPPLATLCNWLGVPDSRPRNPCWRIMIVTWIKWKWTINSRAEFLYFSCVQINNILNLRVGRTWFV